MKKLKIMEIAMKVCHEKFVMYVDRAAMKLCNEIKDTAMKVRHEIKDTAL